MSVVLAAWLSVVQPLAAPGGEPSPEQPQPSPLAAVWLRTEQVDEAALRAALELRFPGTTIGRLGEQPLDARSEAAAFVVADIAFDAAQGQFTLTLVVSDGRAYDRVVTPDPGATPEALADRLARDVANLVVAIEEGTVVSDRQDVPLPEPVEGPQEIEATPASKPAEPPPTGPVEPRPEPAPPPPWVEFGPRLSGGVVIGLGPPDDVSRLVAYGGALGVAVRFRSGGMMFVDLRGLGRTHASTSLARMRVAIGAGYAWRPRLATKFELEAGAAFTVEPWWLLEDGRRPSLSLDPVPAVGGMARVVPGYRWSRPDQRIGLRVGPAVEYGLSRLLGAGGAVARVVAQGGTDPVFRLGGSELSIGLDLVLYVGVHRGRPGAPGGPAPR